MNKRFKITLAKKSGFSNTNAVNKSKQRNMTKLIYPAPSTISVSYIKNKALETDALKGFHHWSIHFLTLCINKANVSVQICLLNCHHP